MILARRLQVLGVLLLAAALLLALGFTVCLAASVSLWFGAFVGCLLTGATLLYADDFAGFFVMLRAEWKNPSLEAKQLADQEAPGGPSS